MHGPSTSRGIVLPYRMSPAELVLAGSSPPVGSVLGKASGALQRPPQMAQYSASSSLQHGGVEGGSEGRSLRHTASVDNLLALQHPQAWSTYMVFVSVSFLSQQDK